jgi:hypothetical protein
MKKGRHTEADGSLVWEFDRQKVQDVVLKLARGHVAFEHSVSRHDEPTSVLAFPLTVLDVHELDSFENNHGGKFGLWPEIGSRAFNRLFTDGFDVTKPGWISVQKDRYRYCVDDSGYSVRIVFSEYLGCEVIWTE